MATNAKSSDGQTPSSRLRNGRGRHLLWIFAALSLFYVLEHFLNVSTFLNGDRTRAKEDAEYEARVLPTEAKILRYLDGETIVPTDPKPPSGRASEPLVIRKESIEGLTLKREDHFFTLATFTLRTDRGAYAVEIFINHHPTDGTFVFDNFRVVKAVRL